jgi:AraC-like DNA-binding protein
MVTGPTGAASPAISVQTRDLDEAREVCGEHLYPRSLRLLDTAAHLTARFAFLHLDGLTVGDIRYGAEIAGDCGELGSYHVNLPLAGTFAASHAGRLINGRTTHAGVYGPAGTNLLHRSSSDCHLLAVKIDRNALEDLLSALLDAPVRSRLRLAGEMDVRGGPGRACARMIRFLASEIDNPGGMLGHPMVAAPLVESLLLSLLYATGHQYQAHLQRLAARCAARQIGRVLDAIQDDPQRPYALADLAEIAGVSISCLRREFQRQVGLSPMAYLRKIRLAAVQAQLRRGDVAAASIPRDGTPAGFALRGRFSNR